MSPLRADTRNVVLVTGTGLVPQASMDVMRGCGLEVRHVRDDYLDAAALSEALVGARGYVIGGYEEPLAEHFDAARTLEVVAWVGTDYKSYVPGWPRAVELGVVFLTAPGANAASVAEFTTALVLMMARPFTAEIVGPGRASRPLPDPGMELYGKTLGIIGLGRIGQHVARIAKGGFGMDVVYSARRRNVPAERELGVRYIEEKDELLTMANVIALHRAGLLPGERAELGRAECDLLKPNAIVVNAGHFGLVDPVALFAACTTRGVRAGFDGIGDGEAWDALVSLGPERFLGVAQQGFNTYDANRRACETVISGLCERLSAGR